MIAKLKSWAWDIVSGIILGIIYWTVISEGLRLLLPVLGQRIHKVPIPGFSYFDRFEATHRLDLAHGLSIFLFIAMWKLWALILEDRLGSDQHFRDSGWEDTDAYKSLVLLLGRVILGADAVLFYIAMTQMGWSGSAFSIPAIIASISYVAVLVFVKLVSINLAKKVKDNSQCVPHPQSSNFGTELPASSSSHRSAASRLAANSESKRK